MFFNVLLVVKWCWGLYPGVSSIVFHQKVGRVNCEYAGKRKTYSKTQSKFHFKSLSNPPPKNHQPSPILSLPRFYSPICCAGVEWFGTSQVRLFRGNDAVNGVELEDGEVLPADCVVVGAGVLPNTRFVEGLSLEPWSRPRGDESNTGKSWGKKTPSPTKNILKHTKKKTKKYPRIIKVYQE